MISVFLPSSPPREREREEALKPPAKADVAARAAWQSLQGVAPSATEATPLPPPPPDSHVREEAVLGEDYSGLSLRHFDYAAALNRPLPRQTPEVPPPHPLGTPFKLKQAWAVAKSLSTEALEAQIPAGKDTEGGAFPFMVSSGSPGESREGMVPVKTMNDRLSETNRQFEAEVQKLRSSLGLPASSLPPCLCVV